MRYIKFAIIGLLISLFSISTANAEIMLFLGEGCRHCEEVVEFIEQNELDIKSYEVYNNKENKDLYDRLTKELGYTGDRVPLIIDGEMLVDGKSDIIAYLDDENPEKEDIELTEEDSNSLNEIINNSSEEEDNSLSTEKKIGIIVILIGLSMYLKILHTVKKLKR